MPLPFISLPLSAFAAHCRSVLYRSEPQLILSLLHIALPWPRISALRRAVAPRCYSVLCHYIARQRFAITMLNDAGPRLAVAPPFYVLPSLHSASPSLRTCASAHPCLTPQCLCHASDCFALAPNIDAYLCRCPASHPTLHLSHAPPGRAFLRSALSPHRYVSP